MREFTSATVFDTWSKEHITLKLGDDTERRVRALVHVDRGIALALVVQINDEEHIGQVVHIDSNLVSSGVIASARGDMITMCTVAHLIAKLAPWHTVEEPAAFVAEAPYLRITLQEMQRLLPMLIPTSDDLKKIQQLAQDYRLASQGHAGTA